MTHAAAGARANKLEGVWCPLLTPLDEELRPDPARFVAHARRVLDQGCHGVAIFGTTGEGTSFSVDERTRLLDAVLEAGLPADRLMVGTGCCALSDTIALSRHATLCGVENLLMLPPFYYKNNADEGLFASYDTVLQRLGEPSLQLVLYHFPKLSGVPITTGLIEKLLAAHPATLAGVKDSSGDGEHTFGLIRRFPEVAVFPGTEVLQLDALQIGGAGCISASANVNAGAIRAVYDAFQDGRPDAAALQDAVIEVRQLLQRRPMIPAMKHLVAAARQDPGWQRMRPPLLTLPAAEGEALQAELAARDWQLAA
jgi:4-hydroxy-tetrahydrodipicolinate synthase